jgi:F-BAR domain only protein
MNNLAESSNRLSSLAESPTSAKPPQSSGEKETSHEGTNGLNTQDGTNELVPVRSKSSGVNGTGETADVEAPVGPPPSQLKDSTDAVKDADGFTIPPPSNDPISQAQKEATEESEQLFKLNIQNEPVAEEDPDAKQAAMSNVANTLTQMALPSRKMGTVRGRRDVRSTIYVPAPTALPELTNENPFPPSPSLPTVPSKPAAVAALASEVSLAGTSDTQSIRSANSLASLPHIKHPEMSGPGLNASIIETVSASFEDGAIKTVKIGGEIAFCYNASDTSNENSEFLHPQSLCGANIDTLLLLPLSNKTFLDQELIKINNFPNLEVIGPNRIFVQNVSTEIPEQFNLDLSHISKTATAFTYRVHSEDTDGPKLVEHAPLLLKTSWKEQGDKLGLLLQYSLNPASKLSSPVTLHNVVFVATYEGARASGAQTKPSGTHLKEKHLVYWRVGDVTLTSEVQKIICRIIGAENAEPKPGHVEARWEYAPTSNEDSFGSGISISKMEESKGKAKDDTPADDDPFADENPTSPALPADKKWVNVPLVRKMVSGKYDST